MPRHVPTRRIKRVHFTRLPPSLLSPSFIFARRRATVRRSYDIHAHYQDFLPDFDRLIAFASALTIISSMLP